MALDLRTESGTRVLLELWKAAPDNLFIVHLLDGEFYIDAINPAQERAVQLDFRAVRGKRLRDVLPEGFAQRICENYQRCIDSGQPMTYEEPYVDDNGKYTYWETQLIPVTHPQVQGAYVFGRSYNITHHRETERRLDEARRAAEHANEVKTAFLANMSHEMRTPLNGIAGAATLLADTDNADDKRELLNVISTSVSALSRLTNDILDYAKLNAGTLKLQLAPLNFRAIVDDVFATVQPLASTKTLQMQTDLGSAGDRMLIGDSDRIRQVLTNLITNAIKFTDHGAIKVELRFASVNDKLDMAKLAVSDTGIGIAENDLKRLFEPFTQIDNTATRRYSGAGLGLAITRQLVTLMGGTIDVQSSPGQGSRFCVEIPLLRALTTEQPSHDKTTAALHGQVLLVEDNATNRLVAQKMLKSIGVDVVTAENGEQALQVFKQGNTDLILMDWHMPVMDGLEATRRIRATGHEGRQVPIIALTANVLDDQRAACLAAGMNDVLTKPISRDALLSRLSQWLGHDNPPA